MNNWKYLILDNGDISYGIAFAPYIQHKDQAEQAKSAGFTVIGAGFLRLYADHANVHVECYGYSDSLDIKSQPGDVDYFKL